MIKFVGNQEICELLGTDNLKSFEENVLKNNIKTVYKAKDITIHEDTFGSIFAIVLL